MSVETRKAWACELQARHQTSIVKSCEVVCISRTAYYYRKRQVDDSEVKQALRELAQKHPRWGCGKYIDYLRNAGYAWNHKRIQRVYTALGLQFRSKRQQRLPARNPMPLAQPETPRCCWSMDFMSDSLTNHRRFRTLNVIDDFNREIP